MTREKWIKLFWDLLADIIGSMIYAVGVAVFTGPNNIAPGGVTGIATMLSSVTGMQIGTLSFLLNIPLIVMGFITLGRKFTERTLRSIFISSVLIDVFENILPEYTGDMFLSAAFGGICMGIGMGLIFMRGSTTGGTDIIGRYLLKKLPHISLGTILFAIDFVIVVIAGFYYGALESTLYAMVAIFCTEKAMDTVLYGLNECRIAYVISDKPDEIAERIMKENDRGITFLEGEGGYSRERKKVIMCAMPSRQFAKFKHVVLKIDPAAFMMIMPTSNVIGEGFKQTFDE